jgi:hypothetical protein
MAALLLQESGDSLFKQNPCQLPFVLFDAAVCTVFPQDALP